MRTPLLFTGLLLGTFAVAGVAWAGRGGDGQREERSAAPAGSGSFRPEPAPRVEQRVEQNFSRPAAPEIRAPRVEPSFSRPPSAPVERYQPPPREERRAPIFTGNATVLPSMNVPYHAPPLNQFRQPASPPSEPAARAAQREDFLGMPAETSTNRAFVPNHFNPQTAPANTSRAATTAIVPSAKSLEQLARRSILPNPPGRAPRPPRPALSEKWQAVNNNYSSQAGRWSQTHSANVAAFQANRGARWNQVRQYQTAAAWRGQYHTPEYRAWRRNLWDYRRARAEEIWDATPYLYENLFNNYWWSTAWWRRHPWVAGADVPPWWWWLPATWDQENAFFGSDLGSGPITYDPGDNVYYDDNTYDVDGQDQGSADDARDQADALANPQVDDIPIPEPAEDGQPEQWLPLGSWALTQQEQGDAVMFFQLSVNRGGIVAGGYKNALTGDEQPIVGQLDKRTQRLAWHIANAPQTVFETGLSSLDYDAASVFLHFNGTQTQTWLLVRLPSPEMPPGEVRVPDQAN